jgi:chromosome segregation ATPase
LLAITLGSTLLFIPALAKARQNQDSVVDASRKAQAAKKTAPKAKISIDNDNLDTLTGTVNVVGQAPAPPVDPAKAAADKAKVAASPEEKKPLVKDEAYWRQQFADANKKMAEDARELDILQREYNLKEQQYYSDPNTAMKQQYDRHDLTDTKTKIDAKTADVAADKQAISDLEDSMRQAGGDPGWASAPPQAPAPEGQ